jgi:hypothetical protein
MRTVSRLVISMAVVSCVGLALFWVLANRTLATPSTTGQTGAPAIPVANDPGNLTGQADPGTVAPAGSSATASQDPATAASLTVPVTETPRPADATPPIATAEPTDAQVSEPDHVGRTPAIDGNANANVRSVVAAVNGGGQVERLTPLLAPKAYDHQRFLADPKAYLDVVEPGRVYQTAQPGEGVPQLSLVDRGYVSIPQGGSTTLRVQSAPNSAVTFTSFDCGAFSNRLTSITVQADAAGIAAAEFIGTPGTINDVKKIWDEQGTMEFLGCGLEEAQS